MYYKESEEARRHWEQDPDSTGLAGEGIRLTLDKLGAASRKLHPCDWPLPLTTTLPSLLTQEVGRQVTEPPPTQVLGAQGLPGVTAWSHQAWHPVPSPYWLVGQS